MNWKPKIKIYFEPRDIWVGVYWSRSQSLTQLVDILRVYICIVPMLPIRLTWTIDVLREPVRRSR